MGRREGLVQVEVHHVNAEVARTRLADQRIHVGAVHVKQRAFVVQDVGDAMNLFFEDADGARVGEHHAGGVLVDCCFKRSGIDHAFGVRFEIENLVAADRRRCRIGAVRRVRDDDLPARITLRLVIGAHQQNAGEFSVRPGGGLERDRLHAGDLDQALGERFEDAQCALRDFFRLIRMSIGQAFEAGNKFVNPRIVFHGARAKRIHAEVDRVVPGREACEVTDDLDLAHLRHEAEVITCRIAQQLLWVYFRNVERRELVSFLAGRRLLEDESLVLRDMLTGLPDAAAMLARLHACTAPTAASICALAFSSVQHQSAALPSSG